MPQDQDSTRVAFTRHSRRWRDFRYVYPVISRRSKGLSIGVNLSPDQVCNFNCVYCQVDRTQRARPPGVDFALLSAELCELLSRRDEIFEEERWRGIPAELRGVRDIAFSGDGEPTVSPTFPAAAGLVAELRCKFDLTEAKIVLLTNACFLRELRVIQTLAFLDKHNGEVWAKLDAGTQAYFERVNGPSHPLSHILDNLLVTARVRPIVIQSLFMRLGGQPPPESEIAAYVGRLRWLLDGGGRLKLVQIYTVARRPAQACVRKLEPEELERIADNVRSLDVAVETYG